MVAEPGKRKHLKAIQGGTPGGWQNQRKTILWDDFGKNHPGSLNKRMEESKFPGTQGQEQRREKEMRLGNKRNYKSEHNLVRNKLASTIKLWKCLQCGRENFLKFEVCPRCKNKKSKNNT